MLVTTENLGPVLLQSHIQQIRADSGPGRIWDHDNGIVTIVYTGVVVPVSIILLIVTVCYSGFIILLEEPRGC